MPRAEGAAWLWQKRQKPRQKDADLQLVESQLTFASGKGNGWKQKGPDF